LTGEGALVNIEMQAHPDSGVLYPCGPGFNFQTFPEPVLHIFSCSSSEYAYFS
jgi:hypothetical protein